MALKYKGVFKEGFIDKVSLRLRLEGYEQVLTGEERGRASLTGGTSYPKTVGRREHALCHLSGNDLEPMWLKHRGEKVKNNTGSFCLHFLMEIVLLAASTIPTSYLHLIAQIVAMRRFLLNLKSQAALTPSQPKFCPRTTALQCILGNT